MRGKKRKGWDSYFGIFVSYKLKKMATSSICSSIQHFLFDAYNNLP